MSDVANMLPHEVKLWTAPQLKSALFGRKTSDKNVFKVDKKSFQTTPIKAFQIFWPHQVTWGQFLQRVVYVQLLRAQVPKAQKDRKDISQKKVGQLFFDCVRVKAARKHVGEIDTWATQSIGKCLFLWVNVDGNLPFSGVPLSWI